MTKLAFMSDLHVDFNAFTDFDNQTLITLLKEEQIDHLHIAGDISNHHHTVGLPFIQLLRQHLTVTYNLGNHDMLDLKEAEIEQLDFKTYTVGSRNFLACHGWYDYSFFPQKTMEESMAFKKQFWFDRRLNRQQSDPQITANIIRKLDDTLTKRPDIDLVALHFVPHENFLLTHPKLVPFNAFLGSPRFHEVFVKHEIADVVFGHSHHSYHQMIDGISYHAHPLGYRREWDLTIDYVNQHPEYNPSGTWNLSKRYHQVRHRKDYHDYTQQYLKAEFQKALTIFDC